VAIGVKLQHGDSSGGGDMADYSTDCQVPDRVFFGSSARTTDMKQWDGSHSTGPLYGCSHTAVYDLRGAKQYLRAGVRVGKELVTTETSGDEHARVSAVITFFGGATVPYTAKVISPFSSTTTT
jgi:hypothetical protein